MTASEKSIDGLVTDYKNRTLGRREFLTRLIGVTGGMAAAHLLLEKSGLAANLVSEVESKEHKVISSTVTYASTGDTQVSGYLCVPQGEGPFPAVIVIHENRGLNEHTRDVARRFAAEGFIALAPDLLSRKGGTDKMESPDAARAAIGEITAEQATDDLKAGLVFLNDQPKVAKGQLASVGFCWGGARSFLLATASDLLRAAVVFYGSAPAPEKIADIKPPVLGLYGETDARITDKVPETAEAMAKAGKSFEYKIYPGAGHAFFNDTGKNYNAEAAKDAWFRTLKFIRIANANLARPA